MSLWDDILAVGNQIEGAVTDTGNVTGAAVNTVDWLSSGGPAELTKEVKQLKVAVYVVGITLVILHLWS